MSIRKSKLKKEFSKIDETQHSLVMKSNTLSYLFLFVSVSLLAKGNVYVQSNKAKLLSQPKLNAEGSLLKIGEVLTPITEQGLFVQVRVEEKTGWVSKLFVSPLPPGTQMKLGITSNSSEAVVARQRASDFTKTAAARGLSETQKMRVRGEGEMYDFESLRWLESVPLAFEETTPKEEKKNGITQSSSFFSFSSNPGLPVLGETKAEVKMGRSLAARLLKKYNLVRDLEFTRYLNSIASKLGSVSSRKDLEFRVGIIDSQEVNAFSCPGGYLFITTGTLKKIQTEAELAGIIAHEMGHVILFHNGEFKESNVFVDILSGLLSPPGSEVVNTAMATAITEMEKQFFETGRDAKVELEADEAAVGLVSQVGYSPLGLSSYLNTMAKSEGTDLLKKTHPETNLRIAKLVYIESSVSMEGTPVIIDRWSDYKKRLTANETK
ncbi:zinc dependent protease [Leptospira ellinghausenii]|uniref:Zinc dependent protease n=2 Tax=Leptospira ellinghausenii TaxID=1917822 RepID=A0A2P2D947_9LEPT|nr:M48 family metalloprotease [Leptospira ellinghausenii]GBF41156.1 zinc dependent protease [Leptospira ellinghausenii]